MQYTKDNTAMYSFKKKKKKFSNLLLFQRVNNIWRISNNIEILEVLPAVAATPST